MTAAALLEDAAAALAAAGVSSPEWDAERLIRHVLGWDRAALIANPDHSVPEPQAERFRALVARRAAREPLQYILGTQAFWKHEFLVTPAVLIPRPETELLVETALELLGGVERPVVVDVGTGSGCIALSIAAERPDAEVHATDVSEPALEVARENARRLGLEGRVAFHRGDLLEPVAHLAGRLDVVVSNPPYVDPAERDALAPEVRDHEPPTALFAPDPKAYPARLASAARRVLRPGGYLVVEIGIGLETAVTEAFLAAGLRPTARKMDLGGVMRALVCRA
jgi:release factor glutamine methyltransferase